MNQWWLAASLVSMGLVSGACGGDKKGLLDIGDDTTGGGDGGLLPDGGPRVVDVCGRHIVRADKAVPDMLIVLDKSGSMAPGGNATRTDRWSGSRNAVEDVTAMFDTSINFGLMTFPGTPSGGGFGGGGMALQCAAGAVDVPLGTGNGGRIEQALGRMRASGYTPTAATLTAALEVIGAPGSADQEVTSAKFILLVTDGDPNCSEGYSNSGGSGGVAPPDPRGRMESIAAIEKLTAAGVQTFVVGFQTATTDFATVLDQMAAAGGTGQKTHQSVENGDDLASAFEKLAGQAASCSYQLSRAVDASNVTVTVAGKARKFQDSSDGWILSPDRKTVSLTGAACDAAQKGGVFAVEVDCEPIIGI